MAFANRVGNLFKQAVNSSPSVYQAIRCMSSSKLFVGGLSNNFFQLFLQINFDSIFIRLEIACFIVLPLLLGLSYGTDDHSLREAFTSYGEVTEGTHILYPSICMIRTLFCAKWLWNMLIVLFLQQGLFLIGKLVGPEGLVLLVLHPVKRPTMQWVAWMGR